MGSRAAAPHLLLFRPEKPPRQQQSLKPERHSGLLTYYAKRAHSEFPILLHLVGIRSDTSTVLRTFWWLLLSVLPPPAAKNLGPAVGTQQPGVPAAGGRRLLLKPVIHRQNKQMMGWGLSLSMKAFCLV